jgi:hypothetical protein
MQNDGAMAVNLSHETRYLTESSLYDTMGDDLFEEDGSLSEHGKQTLADLEEQGQLI